MKKHNSSQSNRGSLPLSPSLIWFLKLFFSITLLVLGLLMLIADGSWLVKLVGAIVVLASILVYKKNLGIRKVDLLLFTSVLIWMYLGTEAFLYIRGTYNYSLCSRPSLEFDRVSGYRYTGNDPVRVLAKVDDHILFDNTFTPNKQGYCSKYDFLPRKKDASILRYILFGDSFCSGTTINKSLAHRLEENLNKLMPEDSIEIYAFALDGFGLANWGNIFQQEIIPNYDFDGILFASQGNNMERKFFVFLQDEKKTYFKYFDDIPDSSFSIEDEKPQMRSVHSIFPYLEGNPPKQIYRNFEFSFFPRLWRQVNKRFLKKKKPPLRLSKDVNEVFHAMGSTNQSFLDSIISHGERYNKDIIFAFIPGRTAIQHHINGQKDSYFEKLRLLSAHYNKSFYEGVDNFDAITQNDLDSLFLLNDDHWNQNGSDLYAAGFTTYMHQHLQTKLQIQDTARIQEENH